MTFPQFCLRLVIMVIKQKMLVSNFLFFLLISQTGQMRMYGAIHVRKIMIDALDLQDLCKNKWLTDNY